MTSGESETVSQLINNFKKIIIQSNQNQAHKQFVLLFSQVMKVENYYNYLMIKAEHKGKKIHLTRAKPNFTIRSLIEESTNSPQFLLQITSITPNQTYLSKTVKILLEEQISNMLDQVVKIINQHNVSIKEGMNYVRSSILFKEIDQINASVVNQIVGEFAKNKIEDLQIALQLKTKELEQLKKQLKHQHEFNQQKLKINRFSKGENNQQLLSLYSKAKACSFQEFQQMFRQIETNNRLSFIQVSNMPIKQKRPSSRHFDSKEQKKFKLMKVLSPLLNNLSEQQRNDLLQILKEELVHDCPNPCCKWVQTQPYPHNRIMGSTLNRKDIKNTSFYKSDKVNQYYKRYYHSAFDINKVRSVTKTQTQEMERLYKMHKTKEKTTHRKKNFRCLSTV